MAAVPTGTLWTCPMDPEIVQDHPGTCPICGMALEPMGVPPADAGPNPELIDFTRRLKIALPFTIPLVVIAMGSHLGLPVHDWLGSRGAQLTELALALPVVIYSGWPFFERGIASIKYRSPNMWTLIAIGVGAAFLYSVVATVFPFLFPEALRQQHGGTVGVYYEVAAVIIVLVLVGQILELRARVARNDDRDNVWIIATTGGDAKRLTNNNDSGQYFSRIAWLHDGSTIMFGKQTRFSLLSMLTTSN